MRVTTLEEEVAATSSLEVGLEAGSGSTNEILDLTLQRNNPVRENLTRVKHDSNTAAALHCLGRVRHRRRSVWPQHCLSSPIRVSNNIYKHEYKEQIGIESLS